MISGCRHKVVETREEAAAMAAKAGVNLNCGYIYRYIPDAIEKGLITETTVDTHPATLAEDPFPAGPVRSSGTGPLVSHRPGGGQQPGAQGTGL